MLEDDTNINNIDNNFDNEAYNLEDVKEDTSDKSAVEAEPVEKSVIDENTIEEDDIIENSVKENSSIESNSFKQTDLEQIDFQKNNEEENVFEQKDAKNSSKVTVRPVRFQEFEDIPPVRTIKKNLEILNDIKLHATVELGRAKSSIKEVMDFEKGSIIELNKIAGEQVEIFINEKLVAKGEVIVIEDKFGVRITNTNVRKPQV